MNYYLFMQIPVLTPSIFDNVPSWLSGNSVLYWLSSRVAELDYSSKGVESFARDLCSPGPPFRWDPERRALLRAELDAAFFHLYGVNREDTDYIMETFPIVKRKDEAVHGEYRTKRLILEVYDKMAEAIRTGEPYQTILDPPPGEGPRHPAQMGSER